jgi:rSAM/selenodomain-associated transferase 2
MGRRSEDATDGSAVGATPPGPIRISVVVPAWNEAPEIARTLASVSAQAQPWEVIVAVGDSDDGTAEAARGALAGVRVVRGARGRARQMNDGAAAAAGDALLFLHADTRLPSDALGAIRSALSDPAVVAGCFRTAFHLDGGALGPVGRGILRAWSARLWMRWHRFAFGDRALFVRRGAFDAVGGFPDQPIFEDLDAVRALRRRGRFAFLDAEVRTSARRFERHGAVRQQLRNAGLWTAWLLGADPTQLKRFYDDRDRG